MKGTTVFVGLAGLAFGLIIGIFILSPETETTVSGDGDTVVSDIQTVEPVRWKMASSFSGNLILLGTQGNFVEERVRTLSGGAMELKFFEPGALVPALEIFDAVSTGSVNAGWTGSRNGPYMNWNNPSTGQSFTCSRNGAYINCG